MLSCCWQYSRTSALLEQHAKPFAPATQTLPLQCILLVLLGAYEHCSGCVQAWLLDFGHSTMCSDAATQAEELEQLLNLFRRSYDSAASGGWLPVSS